MRASKSGTGPPKKRVLVDQLPVQILDQGRVQGAVVGGVRHDEGRGERVGGVHQHSALAGVDLEDPQRLAEAAHLPSRVRVLGARRQALAYRLLGPLVPDDGRAAEVQRQIALQGEMEGEEAQPVLRAPLAERRLASRW